MTILLAVVVTVVAVIAKMVNNKVRDRPGAKPWPVVLGISAGLIAVLYLLLRCPFGKLCG